MTTLPYYTSRFTAINSQPQIVLEFANHRKIASELTTLAVATSLTDRGESPVLSACWEWGGGCEADRTGLLASRRQTWVPPGGRTYGGGTLLRYSQNRIRSRSSRWRHLFDSRMRISSAAVGAPSRAMMCARTASKSFRPKVCMSKFT
jgi:hypothetical protein